MNSADIMTRDLAPMRDPLRWADMWWFRKGTEHPISGDELARLRDESPDAERGQRDPFYLVATQFKGAGS